MILEKFPVVGVRGGLVKSHYYIIHEVFPSISQSISFEKFPVDGTCGDMVGVSVIIASALVL